MKVDKSPIKRYYLPHEHYNEKKEKVKIIGFISHINRHNFGYFQLALL